MDEFYVAAVIRLSILLAVLTFIDEICFRTKFALTDWSTALTGNEPRYCKRKKGNIRNIKLNQNFFDFLKLDLGYAFSDS